MKVSIRCLAIGVAIPLLALGTLFAADSEPKKSADLPIKRVVMFSSGVAFYEHGGEVQGNAQVDLKFNVRNINDLLKSMVLQDDGGGEVSTVSYGSKDPITRTLQTFAIDLTSNPSLGDLLAQIRGEEIELEAPSKVRGTIVGVEKRMVPSGKDSTVETTFLNILADDGLRSVSLDNVSKIRLTNAKLDADLRQALMVLAASKSLDKKEVSLRFLGDGKRPVRVGYIQESPIWKTSYRLVLDDEKLPFLQGWAIVENTTEADWTDVRLTLVSGRPISFAMDLYQPLYVSRPVVVPELFASLRPRTYDQDLASADGEFRRAADKQREAEGLAEAGKSNRRALAAAAPGANGMQGGGFGGGLGAVPLQDRAEKAAASPSWELQRFRSSSAQAADVGEMFEYVIKTPVTIARGSSAMLPIVNEEVKGEKVGIYNESQHPKHPLHGLRLKNSTALHLMQGPITVFDDHSYAGDAQIQDLPPDSERLISYAMDLDTEVAPEGMSQQTNLVSVRLSKGTLLVSNKNLRERKYVVKNSGKRTKKILVEYPLDASWKLVEPAEPTEKTRNMYRFAVTAEPGKPNKLTVKEEMIVNQQLAIANLDDGTIGFYQRAREVSDAVKQALAEVVKRKTALQQVTAKQQELERQIQVIDQEQKRIRENMAQLAKDSEIFRRYEAKFTKQEDEIEALRAQFTASIAEVKKLHQELDAYVQSLELP